MGNVAGLLVLILALILSFVLGSSCTSQNNPVKSPPPVVDTLTANQIVGRYYGQITIDDYKGGTRAVNPGSVTITSTTTPGDGSACACTFSIYLDNAPYSLFTDLLYTAGHPLSLKRECSSALYHFTFAGNCDGRTISGIHNQYYLAGDGSVGTQMFTVSFTATRN